MLSGMVEDLESLQFAAIETFIEFIVFIIVVLLNISAEGRVLSKKFSFKIIELLSFQILTDFFLNHAQTFIKSSKE